MKNREETVESLPSRTRPPPPPFLFLGCRLLPACLPLPTVPASPRYKGRWEARARALYCSRVNTQADSARLFLLLLFK